jgi:hypothetical protein
VGTTNTFGTALLLDVAEPVVLDILCVYLRDASEMIKYGETGREEEDIIKQFL